MTLPSPDDLLLDPPERVRRLLLQDDPFPLETVTDELVFVESHRSDPAMAAAIQKLRAQKATALGKLLSMASEYALNRVAVERGDWLYAEGWIARALTTLVWLAMYAADEFSIPGGNREQRLRDFCRKFSGDAALATVLSSRNQREQMDALISLCIQTIQYVRAEEGEVQVDNENPLVDLYQDPELIVTWPHEFPPVEAKQANLDELEGVLSQMPGYVGTLLIGSFADARKRDPFSDVDVNCICSELPTREEQAHILERMQPGALGFPWPGFGCFLPLGLSATVVHMSFVSQAHQEALFEMRRDQGTEFPLIEISNERFAVGSYYWSTGQILSDRDGSLQSYQREAREIPTRYRASLARRFQSAWERYHPAFCKAAKRQDRVTALTALNACTEAALRAFLLKYDIHTDPMSPTKWLPIEFAHLPTSRLAEMMGRNWIPRDASASWPDRLKDIERLWDATGTSDFL